MVDFLDKQERSSLMARVRGRNNLSTELKLVSLFRTANINGWRRLYPLYGRPDFVFRSKRIAIFTDGCFWHGCPRCYKEPKSNRAFWRRKIETNRARDLLVRKELRKKGWKVIRVWEHQLTKKNLPSVRKKLMRHLQNL